MKYYCEVKKIVEKLKTKRYLICGDFNVRLNGREEGEETLIGPHVFGKGKETIQSMNEETYVNRTMFTTFILAWDLTVANTWFEHSTEMRAMCREIGVEWNAPVTTEAHAELDADAK